MVDSEHGSYIETPDGHKFDIRVVDWEEALEVPANLAANNPHVAGQWTPDVKKILAQAQQLAPALFESVRLDRLLSEVRKTHKDAPATTETPTPEVQQVAVSQAGDIWCIGQHRIGCGDNKDEDFTKELFGDTPPVSVVTDPPYGIDFDTDYTRFKGGKINSDRKRHASVVGDKEPFDPSRFLGYDTVVMFGANCYSDKLPIGTLLVWDKRHASGQAILADGEVAWMKGGYGVYIHTETWQGCTRPGEILHPTQKPVKLMAWCLDKSKAQQPVYDPYLGSGTTAVACHQLNLTCYGAEISPNYVDVAVKRMKEATGLPATLDVDGRTFEEIALERSTTQVAPAPATTTARRVRRPAEAAPAPE
jgi:hypothetical protein